MKTTANRKVSHNAYERSGGPAEARSEEIMQLLNLWCEAQSARERLRNTFKESSKPDNQLTLKSPINLGRRVPHRYPSVKRPLTSAHLGDGGPVTAN